MCFMRRQLHRFRDAGILITMAMFALSKCTSAQAYSVGNGGGLLPAVFNTTPPTYSSGQTVPVNVDGHGNIIISPSSYPSVQVIAPSTTVPVSLSTTIPVAINTTVPVLLTNPNTNQG